MEISPKPGKELCSKIGRIATAIAFAFMICSVAVGPARAVDQHGHGGGGHAGGGGGHGGGGHGGGDHRGGHGGGGHGGGWGGGGNYYYAPAPNYYTAPEPDYYYGPEPEYYPPPPSQGINLFFGL